MIKWNLSERSKKLLWIFCLAAWLAMINAGRGSGISGLKPLQIIFMIWAAWWITKRHWEAHITGWRWLIPVGYFAPILGMFWYGTGEMMPYVTPYMTWRAFEMLLGAAWTLLYFLPLWFFKKV